MKYFVSLSILLLSFHVGVAAAANSIEMGHSDSQHISLSHPDVVDVEDEQIAVTSPRGFLRVLRVTALVGNRGFPTVTASVSKIDTNTASVKLEVFVGAGTIRPASFILPIESQLLEAGLDPAAAKLVIE